MIQNKPVIFRLSRLNFLRTNPSYNSFKNRSTFLFYFFSEFELQLGFVTRFRNSSGMAVFLLKWILKILKSVSKIFFIKIFGKLRRKFFLQNFQYFKSRFLYLIILIRINNDHFHEYACATDFRSTSVVVCLFNCLEVDGTLTSKGK